MNKYPFCGAYLSSGAEGTTVASVLIIFINQNGPEILKNQNLVKAYLMDCVKEQEKEKNV